MADPQLPPGQHLAAPGKWPVVGERAPAATGEPWQVEVAGLVARPRVWPLAELLQLPSSSPSIDIHCVTRWSRLDMPFRGVLLADLLAFSEPAAEAAFVSLVARSPRGHSTSLPLADAVSLGTLVAWEADGQPLPVEHGGPVRVVVPGRYFYKSLKWLARIELLAAERLGYWEAEAGYHNRADPWREQRYIAPRVGRAEMAALLATRNLSGRDLLGLAAADHDLAGLAARGALLRHADFRRAKLAGADFAGANLSNARLQGADLRGANFRDADLEGAHLAGADVRGADFRGASWFGLTWFDAPDARDAARLDATIQFDAAQFDQLSPEQAAWLRVAAGPLSGRADER